MSTILSTYPKDFDYSYLYIILFNFQAKHKYLYVIGYTYNIIKKVDIFTYIFTKNVYMYKNIVQKTDIKLKIKNIQY